jgi:hypothetical protein
MNASTAPAGRDDGAGYLAELAELGEYFALPVHNGDEWLPLPELFADATLSDHVQRTRLAIAAATGRPSGQIPLRVAASSFQLGVAARLLSPVIGSAVCFGVVPVLDERSVRWQPSGTHTPRFAIAGAVWTSTPDLPAAARVIAASAVSALTSLGATLSVLTSLSARITSGNITSAANGAVTVLGLSRPDRVMRGRALVRALLDTAALTGTGGFRDGHFVRRSCCLYYQVPQSGLCGDCVLAVPTASHPGSRS